MGVTLEDTEENCLFSACALVNEVVYSIPLSSIRLGITVMSCLVCLIKLYNPLFVFENTDTAMLLIVF